MICSDSPPRHKKFGFHLLGLIFFSALALAAGIAPAYALLGSTTAVVSSANPSSFGGSVTFTATVTGVGLTPTGSVTFMDGATTLGTSTLNSGTASFSTAALSTGSHSITAVYGGNAVYNSSTSSVLTQTVVANSTSTSIVSSANPSALEQSVIFTATVTSAGGTPTGTVTFMDGSTTLGTSTLNGSGQATFSTTVLTPGNHSITANYSGDANFSAGSSPVLTQTVNLGTSSTAVTSSANPSSFGQPVTFTATVSGLVIQPTGTVTFMDGATTLGTGNLNAGGQATFTTSALSTGSHSITAVYGGNSYYNSSTSNLLTQTVNQQASTTAVSSSANPSALGASVTFTATVTGAGATPTGTVTFKDGATTLGSGTLSSGQATYSTSSLALGAHSITAVYGGDSNYSGSTSPVLTQTVTANSSSTAITSSVNPSTFGQSVTFTATATGSGVTPTGTVTFKDGATTLGSGTLNGSGQATFSTNALGAGSHSITATYNGDSNYGSSVSPTLTQTVNQNSSSTALTSSVNPSAYGAPVTFTATVTGASGTPTGNVTFKDGTTTLGSAALNGSGQTTLSVSSLSVGGHSITAIYGGDTNNLGSTSPVLTQTVTTNSSSTSVASSVNPSAPGQSVTFTATVTGSGVTPTGSVTFKDGMTTLGTGTLNAGGQTTFSTNTLAAGNHSITATYGGDGNYAGGTSSVLTQTVNQSSSSSTSLASSANPSGYGTPVTFTATVAGAGGTPTGTVTFKDGTTTLGTGTLNGAAQATLQVNALAVGSHSITAVYGGDTNFPTSTSAVLTQTVSQSQGATVGLTSSANPSVTGQPVTFTAAVTGSGGTPTGNVTFKDAGAVLGTVALVASSAALTTSSLTAGGHSITAIYNGDSNFAAATSPTLTQSVGTPPDSQRLREMQIAGTQVAAQVSGDAISGAVESAIGEGFEDHCSPLAPSATGFRVTLCPQRDNPQPNDGRIVSREFDALSQPPPQRWLLWSEFRGSELIVTGSNSGLTGRQVDGLVGMTYRFTPDALAGVFAGYEFFDYSSDSLGGRLQGNGWTAGGYFGWRFLPGVRLEAAIARSGVDFNGQAGTATGTFPGNRTFVMAGLAGNYKATPTWELEPSAHVYGLREQEAAYTDSLGTLQADHAFSTGRASAGVKATYLWQASDWVIVAPFAGVYADYYFSEDNSANALPAPIPTLDGLSARLVYGVSFKTLFGPQFALGGELGGIGGNFTAWTLRARASIPF